MTARSMILERKGGLEMGRTLLTMSGVSLGVLMMGIKMVVLDEER